MPRMLLTAQLLVADGRHTAGLMLPLGFDIEACFTFVGIGCHALSELLQAVYINTIEHIGHDRSF